MNSKAAMFNFLFYVLLHYTIVFCLEFIEESEDTESCRVTGICDPNTENDTLESYSPVSINKTIRKMNIKNCAAPVVSYKSVFDELFSYPVLDTLILESVENVTDKHMSDLDIEELGLINATVYSNVLDPLTKLTRLYVSDGSLPTLPTGNTIHYLTLDNADVETVGDCAKLVGLILKRTNPSFTSGWLKPCKRLKELEFHTTSDETVKNALTGLESLSVFRAYNCNLTALPTELSQNKQLRKLDVRKNRLLKLSDINVWFPKLETLMVTEAKLDIADMSEGLSSMRSLNSFSMRGGMHESLCGPSTLFIGAPRNKVYSVGNNLQTYCKVKTENANCSYILQWHQLGRGEQRMSERTWKAASFRSPVYLNQQLTPDDNNTRIICRIVKTRTKATPGLHLTVLEEQRNVQIS